MSIEDGTLPDYITPLVSPDQIPGLDEYLSNGILADGSVPMTGNLQMGFNNIVDIGLLTLFGQTGNLILSTDISGNIVETTNTYNDGNLHDVIPFIDQTNQTIYFSSASPNKRTVNFY